MGKRIPATLVRLLVSWVHVFPFRVNLRFYGSGLLNPSKPAPDPEYPTLAISGKDRQDNALKPQVRHNPTPALSHQKRVILSVCTGCFAGPNRTPATLAVSHTPCRSLGLRPTGQTLRIPYPQRSGLGFTSRKRRLPRSPRPRSHSSFFLFLILTLLFFIPSRISCYFIVPAQLFLVSFDLQKSFKFPSILSPHLH